MESIWMKDYVDKNLPAIAQNIDTPVLIIGGGLAGLMCAYNFMKNGIEFILVDSKKLVSRVSASTTAQVSIAHDKLYEDIMKKHGKDKATAYLNSQAHGLKIIKQIIKDENIECDYKEESAILHAEEEKNIKTLKTQYDIVKKYAKLINKKKILLNLNKVLSLKISLYLIQ